MSFVAFRMLPVMFKGISKMLSRPGGGEWILKRQKINYFLSFYTTLPILSYSIVDIDQNFHCQHLVAEALQELCEKPKQRLRATVDPKSFLKERFFDPVTQSARGCGGIGKKSEWRIQRI